MLTLSLYGNVICKGNELGSMIAKLVGKITRLVSMLGKLAGMETELVGVMTELVGIMTELGVVVEVIALLHSSTPRWS